MRLRSPRPEDEADIKAFFDALAPENRYLRFHGIGRTDVDELASGAPELRDVVVRLAALADAVPTLAAVELAPLTVTLATRRNASARRRGEQECAHEPLRPALCRA